MKRSVGTHEGRAGDGARLVRRATNVSTALMAGAFAFLCGSGIKVGFGAWDPVVGIAATVLVTGTLWTIIGLILRWVFTRFGLSFIGSQSVASIASAVLQIGISKAHSTSFAMSGTSSRGTRGFSREDWAP